ncbi:MAG3090 family protein [Mycoplasmopsis primatum]|uniref:MAG3090 family protein n=1 Tax=Mycoplasmopsis primatum TaxID=55604 RepID=UPI0006904A5B|nr:hypothetical protein [Mycoplasmopsis primatum]
MKRLTLSFDKKNKDGYPWILKHPKIKKQNLARFKERRDAINWYLNLNYESYIWFQNGEGIFSGQIAYLSADEASKSTEFLAIPKVSGFDGGESYEEICADFNIHPSLWTRSLYKSKIEEQLKDLDFIQEADPETYFPADLEMKRKSNASYIDLTSIKANLEAKIAELQNQNDVASETIANLKEALANEKDNFEKITNEIENLKNAPAQEATESPVDSNTAVVDNVEAAQAEQSAEIPVNQPMENVAPEQPEQYDPYAQQNVQMPQQDMYQSTNAIDLYRTNEYYPVQQPQYNNFPVQMQPQQGGMIQIYSSTTNLPMAYQPEMITSYFENKRKKEDTAFALLVSFSVVMILIIVLNLLAILTYTNAISVFA